MMARHKLAAMTSALLLLAFGLYSTRRLA